MPASVACFSARKGMLRPAAVARRRHVVASRQPYEAPPRTIRVAATLVVQRTRARRAATNRLFCAKTASAPRVCACRLRRYAAATPLSHATRSYYYKEYEARRAHAPARE